MEPSAAPFHLSDRLRLAALGALVCVAPWIFSSASIEPFSYSKPMFVELCLAAFLIAWLVSPARGSRESRTIRPYLLPAGALGLSLLLSGFGATNAHEWRVETARWGLLLAFAGAVATSVLSEPQIKRLLSLGVAAGTVVAACTLMEYSGRLHILGIQVVPYRKEGRLLGFFGHQNLIGQYLAPISIWGIGLLLWSTGRLPRVACLAANALILAAVHATYCRSAWISTLFGILTGSLCLRRAGIRLDRFRKAWLAAQAICFLGTAIALERSMDAVAFQSIQEKRPNVVSVKDSGRFDLWSSTLSMIADRPWTGVGAGNFPVLFPSYAPRRADFVRWAHNDYLHLAAEAGIPALAGFLGVVALLALRTRGTLARNDAAGLPCAILAAGAAALLSDAFFSYSLYTPVPSALFWLSAGLLVSLNHRNEPGTGSAPTGITLRHVARISLAAGIALAVRHDLLRQLGMDLHYSRGVFALARGDAPAARAELDAAIKADPENAMLLHTAGSLWTEESPQKARGLLETADRLSPWHAPNLILLAGAYERAGETERLKETLHRLVRLGPGRLDWWTALGATSERTGDLETAERAFRTVVERASWIPAGHFNLAGILAKRGKVDGALLAYSAACVQLPRSPGARLGKALMMERKGWHREALAEYETVLSQRPRDAALLKQTAILCLDRLDEREKGMSYLRRSLEIDPVQPEAARMRDILAATEEGGAR